MIGMTKEGKRMIRRRKKSRGIERDIVLRAGVKVRGDFLAIRRIKIMWNEKMLLLVLLQGCGGFNHLH